MAPGSACAFFWPYFFSWSGVTAGNYIITAKATDNGGLSTTSQSVGISVSTASVNLAPTIQLTSPTAGSNFTAPATIALTANASDADGSIVKVEFYNNWELLLVDDGSTDRSTDIALRYAENWDGKIKYLEHENHQNRGMSATRNLGIKYAKGEYIGFLDADDVWLPEKLAAQVTIFNKYPQCEMVYGRTQIWHSWTGNPEDQKKDYFFPLGVVPNTIIAPPKITLLILENKVQTPTTCNVLIKKSVLEKAGLFVENFKGMFEDAAFFCKASLFVFTYVSDSIWAKYRQHNESCSAIAAKANTDEKARYDFLKWFKRFLDVRKIYSAKIRFFVLREMFAHRYKFLYSCFSLPFQVPKQVISNLFRKLKNSSKKE